MHPGQVSKIYDSQSNFCLLPKLVILGIVNFEIRNCSNGFDQQLSIDSGLPNQGSSLHFEHLECAPRFWREIV